MQIETIVQKQRAFFRTGKTIPLIIPKAASGLGVVRFNASLWGTIRFSTVLMPVRKSSAIARGSAVLHSRFAMGSGVL
jgi:hypothetical protein